MKLKINDVVFDTKHEDNGKGTVIGFFEKETRKCVEIRFDNVQGTFYYVLDFPWMMKTIVLVSDLSKLERLLYNL